MDTDNISKKFHQAQNTINETPASIAENKNRPPIYFTVPVVEEDGDGERHFYSFSENDIKEGRTFEKSDVRLWGQGGGIREVTAILLCDDVAKLGGCDCLRIDAKYADFMEVYNYAVKNNKTVIDLKRGQIWPQDEAENNNVTKQAIKQPLSP